MERFVCRVTTGSDYDPSEAVFPVQHPDGIDGFRLGLYEEAERHWKLLQEAIATNTVPIFEHAYFKFMGYEWETRSLIAQDGGWREYNVETLNFDEWFAQEGIWPGKEV
jgi:hypothetical protein